MVKKEQSKRQKSIKSKLMAAVCMLLVSCIMMVSSTYAWFTLSTAPEVTGITTSVGANGNLEMALQPLSGDSSKITSGTADSMYGAKAVNLANLTWGNLVNLSDSTYYGLNKIMLYPAKLNTQDGTNGYTLALKTNPLATPEYGADGRVIELAEETITGVYDSSEEAFYEGATITEGGTTTTITNAFGVRAVGVSSSMSERQLAWRSAMSTASSAGSKAQTVASQSLNNNGAKLADIAIQHATATTDEKYDNDDLAALQAIIDDLLGEDGSLGLIEEALRQYCVALALNSASDDNYKTAKKNVEDATTLDGMNTTNNETVQTAIDKLEAAITNVETAQSKLTALKEDTSKNGSYAWADISPILNLLANPETMQINTIPVKDLKADWTPAGAVANGTVTDSLTGTTYNVNSEGKPVTSDGTVVTNMSRLVSSVMKQGINLILATGSGVYSDIADFCDDYSASIVIQQISYNGLSVDNLEANMTTATTVEPVYLSQASTVVGTFNVGTGGGSSKTPISDFYGYIIDLAFRTNVADSYLMLQSQAIDRIYSDGTNTDTMGHGASMSFKAIDTKFSGTAVKSLMSAIRIVFFDTDSKNIIGYARLDPTNTTTSSDGAITMLMVMTDASGNLIADDEDTDVDESKAIMALTQNTIHELSIMVYLDGESIGNDDVANAAKSMEGTMNIQFSSSATLVPMDYSDLKTGGGDSELTATPKTVTSTVTDGYNSTAYYYDGKVGVVITDTASNVIGDSSATVTIGGQAATYETFNGSAAWVVSVSEEPSSVEVVVTPNTL